MTGHGWVVPSPLLAKCGGPAICRDCAKELAGLTKHAYHAYGETTGHLNYQGLPMPEWDDLGERIQTAWIAATNAIRKELRPEGTTR